MTTLDALAREEGVARAMRTRSRTLSQAIIEQIMEGRYLRSLSATTCHPRPQPSKNMMLGSHDNEQLFFVPSGTHCSSGGRDDIRGEDSCGDGGVGEADGCVDDAGGNNSDNGHGIGEACEVGGSGGGGGDTESTDQPDFDQASSAGSTSGSTAWRARARAARKRSATPVASQCRKRSITDRWVKTRLLGPAKRSTQLIEVRVMILVVFPFGTLVRGNLMSVACSINNVKFPAVVQFAR